MTELTQSKPGRSCKSSPPAGSDIGASEDKITKRTHDVIENKAAVQKTNPFLANPFKPGWQSRVPVPAKRTGKQKIPKRYQTGLWQPVQYGMVMI